MLQTCRHISLEGMSLSMAFGLAVSSSDLSRETIADYMGWTPDKAARFFNGNDDYWPSLPHLPRLCQVLGNTILTEWAETKAQRLHAKHGKGFAEYTNIGTGRGLESAQEALTIPNAVTSLSSLSKEFTDVLKVCAEAVSDGDINQKEARRIVRELFQLIGAATAMMHKTERLCQQLQGSRRK